MGQKIPCSACTSAFIVNLDDDHQVTNSLITQKDYKPGALARPSEMANNMFTAAENLIRSSNISFSKQKGLTDILTDKIVEHVKLNFEKIPNCHLQVLLRRFAKARLFFNANNIDSRLQIKHKKEIDGKKHASKTSKGVSLN